MIVYLAQDESDPVVITVMRRVEGDGGIIGDAQFEMRKEKGGSFMGHSYEEMLAMGRGRVDIVEK
ncbi:MAG: hypothetical protein CL951_04345 [Erythrobacteraceae bacterium]|jgi:hypothetical protein|nr:hypothetical protein [Erythrobacteraceae bacterium]|tara:strand:- start:207 stop:401 length:195 start_codon:yes stop_codon:yes gene_type:complete